MTICSECGKRLLTKGEALATKARLVAGGAARVSAYRCAGGKGQERQWHVGNLRKKPKVRH